MNQPPQIPSNIAPPPSSSEPSIWSWIFLILGITLASMLGTGIYLLLDIVPERDYLLTTIGSPFVQFYDLGYLCLVPLALIADYYLERRESLAVASSMATLGMLMSIGLMEWMIFPGLGLVVIGTTWMVISILAMLGSQVKGRRLIRYGVFLLAVAGMKLGSLIASNTITWLEFYPDPGNFFVFGIIGGIAFSSAMIWSLRKDKWLVAEKRANRWVPARSAGYMLLVGFLVVTWAFSGLIAILLGNPLSEMKGLYILGIVLLVIGLVFLFGAGQGTRKQKISLATLLGSSVFMWGLHTGQEGFVNLGLESLGLARSGAATTGMMGELIMILMALGMAGLWMRQKRGGETIPIISLMGGLLVMVLFPWIMSGLLENEAIGAEGWWMVSSIFYYAAYAVVLGGVYYLTWVYTPVKLRGLAIGIVLLGEFLASGFFRIVGGNIEGAYFFPGAYSGSASLLGLVGVLAVAGLLIYRIRKSDT